MKKTKKYIADLLDEVQEFGIDAAHPELEMPCIDNVSVAEHLVSKGVAWIPVKVGDIVYKICPICNDKHHGSCEHCAWRGCMGRGCDVGVHVCSDGSHGDYSLQIVPYKVDEMRLITILEYWNTMFFRTTEEAMQAMEEYIKIRETENRDERYKRFKEWESARKICFPFLNN